MPIAKALKYTFFYVLINAFFGLAPLWLILDATLYNFKVNYEEVIKEGMIMFFCIAIIGGISFDYSISGKQHKSPIARYLTIIMPLVALILVAINFVQLKINNSVIESSIKNINTIQWYIVVATIIYCFVVKTFIFINEDKPR